MCRRFFCASTWLILFIWLFAPGVLASDITVNTPHLQQLHTATQILLHRVVITTQGVLVIEVSPVTVTEGDAGWRVRLSDIQQRIYNGEIAADTASNRSPRLRLPPGNYELRITAGDTFTNQPFNLTLHYESERDILVEREFNDTPLSATPLELNRTLLGNSQREDDWDYFALTVAEEGLLIVQLEADRPADGHFWQVAFFQEGEPVWLELDPLLHQSQELVVYPGVYRLLVTPKEDAWQDVDYRLATRFIPQDHPIEELPPVPVELAWGEFQELLLPQEELKTTFTLPPTLDVLSEAYSLALRLESAEAIGEELQLLLLNASEQILWQNDLQPEVGNYGQIIHDLPPGDYTLMVKHSSQREDIALLLGLFLPEELPKTLELQIGNPAMLVEGILREVDPGFATTPMLMEERTMLPVRALVEALGGSVAWDDELRQVTVWCNGHELILWLDNPQALVNGEEREVGAIPTTVAGRTMLPLRFLGEALGCYVEWIPEGERIIIKN